MPPCELPPVRKLDELLPDAPGFASTSVPMFCGWLKMMSAVFVVPDAWMSCTSMTLTGDVELKLSRLM